jgi:hypothetical protein
MLLAKVPFYEIETEFVKKLQKSGFKNSSMLNCLRFSEIFMQVQNSGKGCEYGFIPK